MDRVRFGSTGDGRLSRNARVSKIAARYRPCRQQRHRHACRQLL